MAKIPKTGGFRMNRNPSGSLVLSKALIDFCVLKKQKCLAIVRWNHMREYPKSGLNILGRLKSNPLKARISQNT